MLKILELLINSSVPNKAMYKDRVLRELMWKHKINADKIIEFIDKCIEFNNNRAIPDKYYIPRYMDYKLQFMDKFAEDTDLKVYV